MRKYLSGVFDGMLLAAVIIGLLIFHSPLELGVNVIKETYFP